MNRTLLQHRQRLSAVNELLARMDMAASQEFEDENRQGADEGAQQDKLRMEVLTHQYWQFAVDYHAVTFRLLGEGGIIGGSTMRQIVLELHTCGQRRSHPSAGQDWTRMLPELKFIMQQCRMYLITENKVKSIPGPALRIGAGGEVIMTEMQVRYLNGRFTRSSRVLNRLEMLRHRCQQKVSGCVFWVLKFLCIRCKLLTVFVLVQCIIRATPFFLFHKKLRSDFVVFWPPWNQLGIDVKDVDMNNTGHRELISYGRVLMFFKSVINLDDGSSEEVSLAYIEEFWEYIKHADSSLVGSGNVQLYAAQVYYVIPVERILCKADIMRDPVTPRIPAGALPANHARRERDYPHAKQEGEIGGGSALYIYNNWSMQWGIHAGSPPS